MMKMKPNSKDSRGSEAMKSSKVENIFNYNPPMEESALSPLNYYQPFQSSFDAEFTTGTRPNPFQMKGWSQGDERPPENLRVSGGEMSARWDLNIGGFSPRPSLQAKNTFPTASTSAWREPAARSLCNSTWRSPGPSRSTISAYQEGQNSKFQTSGLEGSGTHSHFPWKSESNNNLLKLGFGSLEGPSPRMGVSLAQSLGHSTSFDASLSHSTYYPLMLRPLGKNLNQNMYKTGHGRPMVCNFCKNNKEVPDIYLNHYLYDPETKVLSCPVLRKHVCEICGGTGDQAHTLQYCPVNRERGLQSKVPVLLKTRTITNSTGKIRRN